MNLYIVATPIGNLEDITIRAISILKEVDIILCEDTRNTSKLLKKYNIKTKTISYHEHTNQLKTDKIIKELETKNIALVTDAGTPCISDPGYKIINKIRESKKDINIIPIPGVSASISALSVSGFNLASYKFLGFIPNKKGRQKFVKNIAEEEKEVFCFYESCYRVEKLLNEIENIFKEKDQKNRKIFIARELTKKFETHYYGNIEEIKEQFKESIIKGEFTIIIDKYV
ncbi:16S rRNA (cytidine(1402)-2'-O)-methyltransferase [Patescibacteria group bacterium]|nr:16S rRNA (cytidine(1402)-2'-O)-methyltransferase [Patescibacteria group bacterium]